MAAPARRAREYPIDADAIDAVRERLRADWADYAIVKATALVELAGDYADAFALCGYDSVQLAVARTLHEVSSEQVEFACFIWRSRKSRRCSRQLRRFVGDQGATRRSKHSLDDRSPLASQVDNPALLDHILRVGVPFHVR